MKRKIDFIDAGRITSEFMRKDYRERKEHNKKMGLPKISSVNFSRTTGIGNSLLLRIVDDSDDNKRIPDPRISIVVNYANYIGVSAEDFLSALGREIDRQVKQEKREKKKPSRTRQVYYQITLRVAW